MYAVVCATMPDRLRGTFVCVCRPKGGDGEPVQPVYGEPAWIVVTGLKLIVRRGVTLEVKKPALQMVLLMFQGGLSRPTDACVLLEGLRTIRTWILDPPTPGEGPLSRGEVFD